VNQLSSRVVQVFGMQERLPDELRQVFERLYVRGMSEAAVSAELGIPMDAVRERRTRALRSLRAAVN
jgi:DNA-directed RNA polymerase specialized sigma24 family protein